MLATMTTATVGMGVYLTNDPEPIFKYRHNYILLLRQFVRMSTFFSNWILPVCVCVCGMCVCMWYVCMYVCIILYYMGSPTIVFN